MVQKTFTKKSKVTINHWCDQYFNDHLGTLPKLDRSFEDLNFHDMDDINALKIMLYYFADILHNRRKDK